MSLFSRAHDIAAAKANKALDSVENPNEMLDYSYEQMLDYITRVRQALVTSLPSGNGLSYRSRSCGTRSITWGTRLRLRSGRAGKIWPGRRCLARPPRSSSSRDGDAAPGTARARAKTPGPSASCSSG